MTHKYYDESISHALILSEMKEKKSISFCHTWIIELLMSYFFDDDFKFEYLEIPVLFIMKSIMCEL